MVSNQFLKTEKILYVRNALGKTLRIVREHYLRNDVSCKSRLCEAGCHRFESHGLSALLPTDITHYLIPHRDIVIDYLELFEDPKLRGIIFLHTIIQSALQESGRRFSHRFKAIVRDIRRESIIFYNDFHKDTYCEREPGESLIAWQSRCTYRVAAWFYIHLAMKMPIIIVTENNQMITQYENLTIGIFVLSLQDYLQKFCPDWTAAFDIYESLSAALTDTQEIKGLKSEYQEYLSLEVLKAGIKTGFYVAGILQVSNYYSSKEAFVIRNNCADSHFETVNFGDILISGMTDRNRAIHGDLVVVEILPKVQWKGNITSLKNSTENEEETSDEKVRPTGKVVGILQKNWRNYVACFAEGEEFRNNRKSEKLLVVPYDCRIPKIRISTRQAEALKNDRIIVRIDHWKTNSLYPNGHFVKTLGKIGDLETEIATILVEHCISTEKFSTAQIAELPGNTNDNPWSVSDNEISKRRDFRKSHFIFSIDPKGCEDVDDALSVRKLSNGHFELGVHIADVTHFVAVDSQIDLEAKSRATTVYLADQRYNMLPELLSSDICSLRSQKDRYAVSILWELDGNFQIIDSWCGRTVIKSSFKLIYEVAQKIYDGETMENIINEIPELISCEEQEKLESFSSLHEALVILMEITKVLKSHRLAAGALELEGMEVQVMLDDTKNIESLTPKEPLQIHETVAECMLFANQWVAKVIEKHFPHSALLRRHPAPPQEQFEDLINCAKAKGFKLDTRSNKTLSKSLDMCVDKNDPWVNKILRKMTIRAMPNALYFSTGSLSFEEFYHYGLAVDYYTHFTSPIRRYADVIVHRLLLAAINHTEKSTRLLGNKEMEELCRHINSKKKASQNIQRKSLELFQALYFQDKSADDPLCVGEGIIYALRSNGACVFIPQYGIHGSIHLSKKDGNVVWIGNGKVNWIQGTVAKSSSSLIISTTLGSQTYSLFDHIMVKISIKKSRNHPHDIFFDLLSKQSLMPNEEWPFISNLSTDKTDIVKEVSKSLSQQNRILNEDYSLSQVKSQETLYNVIQHFKLLSINNIK